MGKNKSVAGNGSTSPQPSAALLKRLSLRKTADGRTWLEVTEAQATKWAVTVADILCTGIRLPEVARARYATLREVINESYESLSDMEVARVFKFDGSTVRAARLLGAALGDAKSDKPNLHDEIRSASFVPGSLCQSCGANVFRWLSRASGHAACNGCGQRYDCEASGVAMIVAGDAIQRALRYDSPIELRGALAHALDELGKVVPTMISLSAAKG